MSAVELIFPSVPTPPATPATAVTQQVAATQVIETVGVEVLDEAPYVELENVSDSANDVIPFASTLRRVG